MNKHNSMEKLLSQLDKKKIPVSIQGSLIDAGGTAFDFLSDSIKTKELSSKQKVNVLHMLYSLSREKCYGKQSDLFDIANSLMTNKSVEVRTESAIISVNLANLFDTVPNLNPDFKKIEFIQKIGRVLQAGVLDKAKPLLEKYLTTYINANRPLLLNLCKWLKQRNEPHEITNAPMQIYANQIKRTNSQFMGRSMPHPATTESVCNKKLNISTS